MRAGSKLRGLNLVSGAVVGASLAAALVCILLYLLHFSRGYLQSDDAVQNLLAETLVRQGSLFAKGWAYYNGDVLTPSAASIIALALNWLPNGFTAHAVASVFALLLMLISTAWLLRVLAMPRIVVLFFCLLSVTGFCLDFQQLLYRQTTYVWWPAGLFLGAALIARHRLRAASAGGTIAGLWLVMFPLSFMNPPRVALMVVIPLFLFDRVLALSPPTASPKRTFWRKARRRLGADDPVSALGLVASFLCALLLYKLLKHLGAFVVVDGAAALYWDGWKSVAENLAKFPRDWLAYLGDLGEAGQVDPRIGSLLHFYRKVFALWLCWVGISEAWRIPRQRDPLRRALAIAWVGAFVPIFFLYNFFEPLAVNGGTIRYFQGAISVLIVLAAIRMRDYVERFDRASPIALSVMALFLAAIALQRFVPAKAIGTAEFWNVHRSKPILLAETLEREGLRWGYATWWNAGATTVVSDFRTRVSPIELTPRGVWRFGFMNAREWYVPEQWRGPTFLALDEREATAEQNAVLDAALGPPVRSIDAPPYRVLVYDHNIARDFASFGNVELNAPIPAGTESARLISAELPDGGRLRTARVQLRNEGAFAVGGKGRFPLAVGISLYDERRGLVDRDWLHVPLRSRLDPAEENSMTLALPPIPPGKWRLRFDLLQEGVAWHGDRGAPVIDLPIEIPFPPDRIFKPDAIGDRVEGR